MRRLVALLATLLALSAALPAGAAPAPDATTAAGPQLARLDRSTWKRIEARQRTDLGPQGGALVTPAATPVPPGYIGIVSSVGYTDGNSILIIGDLFNNLTTRRADVELTAYLYDVADNLVGILYGPPFLDELAYGSQSPVVLAGDASAEVDYYDLALTAGTAVPAAPVAGLTITRTTTPIVGDTQTFNGTVFNHHPTYGIEITVAVMTFNVNGDVIDATWSDPGCPVSPNTECAFSLPLFYDPGDAPVRAVLVAQGHPQFAPTTYATSWNNYFDDIGTISFRNDILWLAEHGITKGCGAGKYCPAANVRRDEMASFLARAMGLTDPAPDVFVDDEGNSHEPNINRIADAGVTSGCNPALHYYCPAANVRRDEMASFLSRALGLTGTPANAFTDDNGNTHELNINRVAAAGITSGCGPTTYCPTAFVTRAQMAAFLRRAFEE